VSKDQEEQEPENALDEKLTRENMDENNENYCGCEEE